MDGWDCCIGEGRDECGWGWRDSSGKWWDWGTDGDAVEGMARKVRFGDGTMRKRHSGKDNMSEGTI